MSSKLLLDHHSAGTVVGMLCSGQSGRLYLASGQVLTIRGGGGGSRHARRRVTAPTEAPFRPFRWPGPARSATSEDYFTRSTEASPEGKDPRAYATSQAAYRGRRPNSRMPVRPLRWSGHAHTCHQRSPFGENHRPVKAGVSAQCVAWKLWS
jgi:hypothetical protein